MKAKFPTIVTDRLLLRQFTDSDLENVFKGLSDPDVIEYYGVSYKSLEETKKQLQFFRKLEDEATGIWWAICSRDNKIFYGAAGLNNLSNIHKKAEVGFWLLTDYWRRGISSEAILAILNYSFLDLGLNRVEAFVETENLRCKKTLSKLGFHHDGSMMDCEIKNEKFISLDIYARLSGK